VLRITDNKQLPISQRKAATSALIRVPRQRKWELRRNLDRSSVRISNRLEGGDERGKRKARWRAMGFVISAPDSEEII